MLVALYSQKCRIVLPSSYSDTLDKALRIYFFSCSDFITMLVDSPKILPSVGAKKANEERKKARISNTMVKDPLKELNVRHIHTKGQRATSSFGKSAKVSIEIHPWFQFVAQSVDFGNINIVILPLIADTFYSTQIEFHLESYDWQYL